MHPPPQSHQVNLPHHKMAPPVCASGGRRTSYLHDTPQTVSLLTVPSSAGEIEVVRRCADARCAWRWWAVTEFCHGKSEGFWWSLVKERESAVETEAGLRTRSCRLGVRGGCYWSTSAGPPWCSAACWAWSPGRGVSWAGCVRLVNWESWSKEMCSEERCFLEKK